MNQESEEVIEKRWQVKRMQIDILHANIRKLRLSVSKDIKSDDEKDALTALAIAIMDKTAERVGNEDSANNGHFGVTGFEKNHISIEGNKVTIEYIGKSGVNQTKTFYDKTIAEYLKKAIKNSPSNKVFCTSDNFCIKNDRINRYLNNFEVRAKDLRGYCANKWTLNELKKIEEIADDEKKRIKQINKCLKSVALDIGHGTATLKKHYLLPEIYSEFVSNGRIVDISEVAYEYESGGVINANTEKEAFFKIENIYLKTIFGL